MFGLLIFPLVYQRYCMPQAVDCDLLLYADAPCLVFRDHNVSKIEKKLNRNFNSLCDWFVNSKQSIQARDDKTKSIVFCTKI